MDPLCYMMDLVCCVMGQGCCVMDLGLLRDGSGLSKAVTATVVYAISVALAPLGYFRVPHSF